MSDTNTFGLHIIYATKYQGKNNNYKTETVHLLWHQIEKND